MSLELAVQRDLDKLPEDLGRSALAETALTLARLLDDRKGSPSECAKALMQALEQIRGLTPPAERKDGLDDLIGGRVRRLARLARGADPEA